MKKILILLITIISISVEAQNSMIHIYPGIINRGNLYIHAHQYEMADKRQLLDYLFFYMYSNHPSINYKIYFTDYTISTNSLYYKPSINTYSKSLDKDDRDRDTEEDIICYTISIAYRGMSDFLLDKTDDELKKLKQENYTDIPSLYLQINPTNIEETIKLIEFGLTKEVPLKKKFWKLREKGYKNITDKDEESLIINHKAIKKVIRQSTSKKIKLFLEKYPFENAEIRFHDNTIEYVIQ
jgi:hypothetical protein